MTVRPADTPASSVRPHEQNDAVGAWMAAVGPGRNAAFALLIAGAIILALLATAIEGTLTRSLDSAGGVLAQPPSRAPR